MMPPDDPITKSECFDAFWEMEDRERQFDKNTGEVVIRVGPGPDGMLSHRYIHRLNQNIKRIRDELNSGKFRPGEMRQKKLEQPGSKVKTLFISNFMDRVRYHIILQRLNHYDHLNHSAAVAYRPRIGLPGIIDEVADALLEYPFFLIMDLEKFFPSYPDHIVHQALRRIESGEVVRSFVENFIGFRKNWTGLPMGCALSPSLANLGFFNFDTEFSQLAPFYRRYSDDIFMTFQNRRARDRIRKALTGTRHHGFLIKMELKGTFPDERPVYLGVEISEYERKPSEKAIKKLKGHVRKFNEASVQGWKDHYLRVGVIENLLDDIINLVTLEYDIELGLIGDPRSPVKPSQEVNKSV